MLYPPIKTNPIYSTNPRITCHESKADFYANAWPDHEIRTVKGSKDPWSYTVFFGGFFRDDVDRKKIATIENEYGARICVECESEQAAQELVAKSRQPPPRIIR